MARQRLHLHGSVGLSCLLQGSHWKMCPRDVAVSYSPASPTPTPLPPGVSQRALCPSQGGRRAREKARKPECTNGQRRMLQ